MVTRPLGSYPLILHSSDTLIAVPSADPAPDPVDPFTSVAKLYTLGGMDFYEQQRVVDGPFTPA